MELIFLLKGFREKYNNFMRLYPKEKYDARFIEASKNINKFYSTKNIYSTNGYVKNEDKIVPIDDYMASKVISELLIKDVGEYKIRNIKQGDRKEYFDHPRNSEADSSRAEEYFQRKLFTNEIEIESLIKEFADEEFIWIELSIDSCNGKATDLISYNDQLKRLSMYELKYGDNEDTLLRTVLEIQTYYQKTNFKKIKPDFKKNYKNANKPIVNIDLDFNNVRKVVLIGESTVAYRQYKSGEYPNVIKLMELFGIELIHFKEL